MSGTALLSGVARIVAIGGGDSMGGLTKYKVVYSTSGLHGLECEVNLHLKLGWKLQGGFFFNGGKFGHYCQAMVKEAG